MNLNQVTVPSTDVRRSIDFYQRLGLVLIVEDLASYARFECPEADATFSVHQTGQPPGNPGIIVYLECEDLDATVARLKEGGLRFESESQDQPWLWREAFLKDPDGWEDAAAHASHRIKETATGSASVQDKIKRGEPWPGERAVTR